MFPPSPEPFGRELPQKGGARRRHGYPRIREGEGWPEEWAWVLRSGLRRWCPVRRGSARLPTSCGCTPLPPRPGASPPSSGAHPNDPGIRFLRETGGDDATRGSRSHHDVVVSIRSGTHDPSFLPCTSMSFTLAAGCTAGLSRGDSCGLRVAGQSAAGSRHQPRPIGRPVPLHRPCAPASRPGGACRSGLLQRAAASGWG
jgi:hypothetical protein